MSATMHVVCLKDTGHTLAAVAAATAGAAPTLEATVGTDLPIANRRDAGAATATDVPMRTRVPASLLELKSVPLDEAVIANPMHHAVDGGQIVRLPDTVPTAPTLTGTAITLADGVIGTISLAVLAAHGDPADQRRVQSGKFVDADGDGTVEALVIPLSILPGDTPAAIESAADYDVFVAFAGLRPSWWTVTSS
jgi:hypothetical protein